MRTKIEKIEELTYTKDLPMAFGIMCRVINKLVRAHNSSLTHSTGVVDNEFTNENRTVGKHLLCGHLIQATVEGTITCANPKGRCPMHESELKFCAICVQMTNHNDTTCLKCGLASPSPREEWEEGMEKILIDYLYTVTDVALGKHELGKTKEVIGEIRKVIASSLRSEKERMRAEIIKEKSKIPKPFVGHECQCGNPIHCYHVVKTLDYVLSLIDNTDK